MQMSCCRRRHPVYAMQAASMLLMDLRFSQFGSEYIELDRLQFRKLPLLNAVNSNS